MKNTIIKILKNNDYQFQILKACEELSELTTALIQYNIKEKKDKQSVINEIGDVKIRIWILEEMFGNKEVDKRITEKLAKFNKYIEEGKYKNNI